MLVRQSAEQSNQRANAESNTEKSILVTVSIQLQQSLEWNAESLLGNTRERRIQSPGVVHDVLHYLVQNLFEESRPDPDVFDGLCREGLRGAAGGGGALSPQRFMAHALGSPAGHKRHNSVNGHDYTVLQQKSSVFLKPLWNYLNLTLC